MAYRPHVRIVVGGVFAEGQGGGGVPQGIVEEWSMTTSWLPSGGLVMPLNELDDALVLASRSLFFALGDLVTSPHIAANVYATTLKANAIGSDGRYVDGNSPNTYTYADDTAPGRAQPKGTGANVVDLHRALKVTLRTERRRGPGSRGGFYLPAPSVTVQPSGRLAGAALGTLAGHVRDRLNTAAGVLEQMGLTPAAGWAPVIASNVGNPGPALPVQRVELGDVADVIQSRRRGLPEAYQGVGYPF